MLDVVHKHHPRGFPRAPSPVTRRAHHEPSRPVNYCPLLSVLLNVTRKEREEKKKKTPLLTHLRDNPPVVTWDDFERHSRPRATGTLRLEARIVRIPQPDVVVRRPAPGKQVSYAKFRATLCQSRIRINLREMILCLIAKRRESEMCEIRQTLGGRKTPKSPMVLPRSLIRHGDDHLSPVTGGISTSLSCIECVIKQEER